MGSGICHNDLNPPRPPPPSRAPPNLNDPALPHIHTEPAQPAERTRAERTHTEPGQPAKRTRARSQRNPPSGREPNGRTEPSATRRADARRTDAHIHAPSAPTQRSLTPATSTPPDGTQMYKGGTLGDKGGKGGIFREEAKSKLGQKRPGSFPATYSTIWTILWGKFDINPTPTR